MKLLRTVEAAKKEIKELHDFVFMVETYKPSTLEEKILKEYALLGSISKVVEKINDEHGRETIDGAFVTKLITSKPQDELHRRLKTNYLMKTRHQRTKPRKKSYY